jgi:hypothetical protein
MKHLAIALLCASSLSTGVAYAQNAKQVCRQNCAQTFQACMREAADSAGKKECFDAWKVCNGGCS